MSSSSSVTVIIPVYNGERYIKEAIDSVLSQTRLPDEILVVDDGSIDNTKDVVYQYLPNVTYYLQSNQGAAAARNYGVTLSQGELIAFLDADDLWHPDKLALQLETHSKQPEVDMVFTQIEEFVSLDSLRAKSGLHQVDRGNVPALLPSALLVRRSAFQRIGFFSTEFGVGEFIEWFARAIDEGLSYTVVPKILVRRRIHDRNQGVIKQEYYQREYLRILKKILDRRRQCGDSES